MGRVTTPGDLDQARYLDRFADAAQAGELSQAKRAGARDARNRPLRTYPVPGRMAAQSDTASCPDPSAAVARFILRGRAEPDESLSRVEVSIRPGAVQRRCCRVPRADRALRGGERPTVVVLDNASIPNSISSRSSGSRPKTIGIISSPGRRKLSTTKFVACSAHAAPNFNQFHLNTYRVAGVIQFTRAVLVVAATVAPLGTFTFNRKTYGCRSLGSNMPPLRGTEGSYPAK